MDKDKFNFLKDGAIKQLPPGFRFQPTDEEIVFQYLLRKVFSCPLPALIIPDIDISRHDPWDLPGNMEQDRYFFSNKEAKYRNGNLTNRATMSGYWKPTGIDKKITRPKGKPIILGMKKTLVFYRGKPCYASRTDWIMHEYRLVLPINPSFISQHFKKSPQGSLVQIGNLVLCHISLRKRNGKNEVLRMVTEDNSANQHIEVPKPIWFYDFMSKDLNDDRTSFSCFSNSVSSDASALTEVSSSSSGLIEHEEASNQFL